MPKISQTLETKLEKKHRLAAVDLGAGIGRVAQHLPLVGVQHLTVVEPCEQLRAEADRRLPGLVGPAVCVTSVGVPMQDFEFKTYDLVLANWVLMYLSDSDVVDVLARAAESLRNERSVVVVKENAGGTKTAYDPADGSYSRPLSAWRALFKSAGLKIVTWKCQRPWPKDLEKLYLFALRPSK